jgi:hypothetical protein
MKTMITLLALTLVSLNASASAYEKYDFKAVGLVNTIQKNCPNEFAQLMQNGNMVLDAEEIGGQDPAGTYDSTVLTTGIRYPAPSFAEKAVAKLTIQKFAPRTNGPIAADAGPQWQVTCRIEALNQ